MKINLQIERLVLDGVAMEPHHRAGLKAAVEAELARLLTGNDFSSHMQESSLRAVQGDSIRVGERNEPSALGRRIARSIHKGIE